MSRSMIAVLFVLFLTLIGLTYYAVVYQAFDPLGKDFISSTIGSLLFMVIKVILIAGLVQWFSDRRWMPVRKEIRDSLVDDISDLFTELWKLKAKWSAYSVSDGEVLKSHRFMEALNSSSLEDRLQYLTPAMTPELSNEIRIYTKKRRDAGRDLRDPALPGDEKMYLERLQLWMDRPDELEPLPYGENFSDLNFVISVAEWLECVHELVQSKEYETINTSFIRDHMFDWGHMRRGPVTAKLKELYDEDDCNGTDFSDYW